MVRRYLRDGELFRDDNAARAPVSSAAAQCTLAAGIVAAGSGVTTRVMQLATCLILGS
jgi:predicted branched-subunit amino acid permease